jgi:hypothetical protein
MRRLRRRPREGCGFSSLMKQNKKGKNYAVFCFAGKKKLLFYIYAVIVKQFFCKRSTNHYFGQPSLSWIILLTVSMVSFQFYKFTKRVMVFPVRNLTKICMESLGPCILDGEANPAWPPLLPAKALPSPPGASQFISQCGWLLWYSPSSLCPSL